MSRLSYSQFGVNPKLECWSLKVCLRMISCPALLSHQGSGSGPHPQTCQLNATISRHSTAAACGHACVVTKPWSLSIISWYESYCDHDVNHIQCTIPASHTATNPAQRSYTVKWSIILSSWCQSYSCARPPSHAATDPARRSYTVSDNPMRNSWRVMDELRGVGVEISKDSYKLKDEVLPFHSG